MNLGFNGNFSDKRKEWLVNYDRTKKDQQEVIEGPQHIKDFIDNRLILYHKEAIDRMIPDIMDGFKESQRKIIYTCFELNSKTSIKVVQLTGSVMEKTCYHHGETSLYDSIVKLAQGFVGARNLPLLVNDGMFGTRMSGGDDASAARYIFTKLENIAKYIFVKDDNDILERVEDEGKIIEPTRYMPIIPMILVNGCKGIGSGFSTDIPSFNPLDIIKWIKSWIQKKEKKVKNRSKFNKLVPWWRGYTGTVELDEEKCTITTTGKMVVEGNKYIITELPIKCWTISYTNKVINKLITNGKISNFEKYNGVNSINMIITPSKDFEPTIVNMGLSKTKKMTNMVMLVDGVPKKFDTPKSIIKHFCKVRYPFYEKRKKHLLSMWENELELDKMRHRFISEIINKTLIVSNRDEDELFKEMEEKEYKKRAKGNEVKPSFNYLIDMPIRSMSKQKLQDLQKDIDFNEKRIKVLKSKTNGDLWLEDLSKLEEEYNLFLETRNDDVCDE